MGAVRIPSRSSNGSSARARPVNWRSREAKNNEGRNDRPSVTHDPSPCSTGATSVRPSRSHSEAKKRRSTYVDTWIARAGSDTVTVPEPLYTAGPPNREDQLFDRTLVKQSRLTPAQARDKRTLGQISVALQLSIAVNVPTLAFTGRCCRTTRAAHAGSSFGRGSCLGLCGSRCRRLRRRRCFVCFVIRICLRGRCCRLSGSGSSLGRRSIAARSAPRSSSPIFDRSNGGPSILL